MVTGIPVNGLVRHGAHRSPVHRSLVECRRGDPLATLRRTLWETRSWLIRSREHEVRKTKLNRWCGSVRWAEGGNTCHRFSSEEGHCNGGFFTVIGEPMVGGVPRPQWSPTQQIILWRIEPRFIVYFWARNPGIVASDGSATQAFHSIRGL